MMSRARAVPFAAFAVMAAFVAVPTSSAAGQQGAPSSQRAFDGRVTSLSELDLDTIDSIAWLANDGKLLASGRRNGVQAATTMQSSGRESSPADVSELAGSTALSFDASSGALVGISDTRVVRSKPGARTQRTPGAVLGLRGVVAATFDTATSDLLVLDQGGRRIVRVANGSSAAVTLDYRAGKATALASNPSDGLVYAAIEGTKTLVGLDATTLDEINRVDLSSTDIQAVATMVFAPTTDSTDAPEAQSLFIVDPGDDQQLARLVEVGLEQPALAAESSTLVLLQDFATSTFAPPSPDPAGIAYVLAEDRLWITDSEVNEMPLYAGANLFQVTRSGALASTGTTVPSSSEPTGASFDPATDRLFTSDDDADRVYVRLPGADGARGTSDDVISSFSTAGYGSLDAEGVAFDPASGHLFVVDGDNKEVYRIDPGANGVFEGSAGDDGISSFDLLGLGATDPEGIAVDADRNTLVVTDRSTNSIFEVSMSGSLLNIFSLQAPGLRNPAGITLAPASNSSSPNYWVVDRGVDNNVDPSENDGRLFEFVRPVSSGNLPPSVAAGPDESRLGPGAITLSATVGDDGLPNPPGATTIEWTQVSGPASVTFAAPTSLSTSAEFPAIGVYELRAAVSDSLESSADEISVEILDPNGPQTISVTITNGSDDAEERSNGQVNTTSSDLELVFDKSNQQTVGLRFASAAIPPGATVVSAYVQFQVDEASSGSASLNIAAEATDNALTFSGSQKVSSRALTVAATTWNPAAWSTIGEVGPDQRTPDLSAVIQEVVSRQFWAEDNAIALIITGTGTRTAESSNGSFSPVLHVTFTTGAVPNYPPTVDAGPDQDVQLASAVTLIGTASDDGLPTPPGAVTTTWTQLSGANATINDPLQLSTNVTFPALGNYVFRLTADDGEFASFDDVTISVTDTSGPFFVDTAIASSGDDTEENRFGQNKSTSSDLELVDDGPTKPQVVGLRFIDVQVPVGAIITSASVQFQADETNSEVTNLFINADAADDSAPFSSTRYSLSNRPRTAATVPWSPPTWAVIGEAGPAQATPNLASVVQEIVDRPGWLPGGAITFVITGTGERTAESFDGSAAPELHIEYFLPL